MEAAVEEKFGYLESLLGNYIVSSDVRLTRIEKEVSELTRGMQAFTYKLQADTEKFKQEIRSDTRLLKEEMKDFKDEMKDFKDEMKDFKDEMKDFKDEMKDFKDEMKDFKDEMKDFKDEMKDFKDEMKDFKDEMKDFKDGVETFKDEMTLFKSGMETFKDDMTVFKEGMETFKVEIKGFETRSEKDRQAMNKKWGELANKMGTIVEDIVAPSIPDIARQYFGIDELDSFSVRAMRKSMDRSQRREFDVLAEGGHCFFVIETKATPRTEYLQDFVKLVPSLNTWFPELQEKKLIPIFASLYIPENSIAFLTKNRIFALAMKGDTMDILNPQLLPCSPSTYAIS
ncbi:conserved hypothetical protein [Desulfamplus magnetovallimortis]|uniref:Uncharacterized protein n=1 Tax=Desulfamplus magnetovallimortis TaxID=1246637 RepID=A0A1W1H9V5_9BACT|nr:hypothetical protein [Desulfamplus magnetovallimortis]SLM29212.1 conserved hypothetical protein [Desulfamplus magnetovallimortis]